MYCDPTCQTADYKPRHKYECSTFARLPTTMAFQYEADTEERFPQQVTIEGRIDCEYVDLLVL